MKNPKFDMNNKLNYFRPGMPVKSLRGEIFTAPIYVERIDYVNQLVELINDNKPNTTQWEPIADVEAKRG